MSEQKEVNPTRQAEIDAAIEEVAAKSGDPLLGHNEQIEHGDAELIRLVGEVRHAALTELIEPLIGCVHKLCVEHDFGFVGYMQLGVNGNDVVESRSLAMQPKGGVMPRLDLLYQVLHCNDSQEIVQHIFQKTAEAQAHAEMEQAEQGEPS